jgi:hypothetical protein
MIFVRQHDICKAVEGYRIEWVQGSQWRILVIHGDAGDMCFVEGLA